MKNIKTFESFVDENNNSTITESVYLTKDSIDREYKKEIESIIDKYVDNLENLMRSEIEISIEFEDMVRGNSTPTNQNSITPTTQQENWLKKELDIIKNKRVYLEKQKESDFNDIFQKYKNLAKKFKII